MFKGPIESKVNYDHDAFLELRYRILKEFSVKESLEKERLLQENVGANVKYFLRMEENTLKEGHIIREPFSGKEETIVTHAAFPIEKLPSFLYKIMPFMGYIHWGILPGGKRKKEETMVAIFDIIAKSKKLIMVNNEIFLNNDKEMHMKKGISWYYDSDGFYYLGYLMGSMRTIEGATNLAYKVLDEERSELIKTLKNEINKNKVRLLLHT